jgi:8-oxo-dGTP diphosphatase
MNYKIPKLTVDGILIDKKRVLLIKRKNEPFKGKWSLPGGFVEYGETVEHAVVREFLEETNLSTCIKELFGVYSEPNRDPRGHTITIVFLLEFKSGEIKSGDDAVDAKFFELNDLPELSFDHEKIIRDIIQRCK